jgi:hypothetical protein
MAAERRWDIVLRVMSGPLGSPEPQVFQGPTVEVGTQPRAGGLKLPEGRGVAPKHCTITAYAPQQVFVTPVGHNQVRLAPYAEVDWSEQEPIAERVYLKPGNALHLGPPGHRGITLEFLSCQDLGLREVASIVSAAEPVHDPGERPPDGIRAEVRRPSVAQLVSEGAASRQVRIALGLMMLLSGLFTIVAALALVYQRGGTELAAGEVVYEDMDFSWKPTDRVLPGFQDPLYTFVIEWNERLGRGADHGLVASQQETWDHRFFFEVEKVFGSMKGKNSYFRHLDEVRSDYAAVLGVLRSANPPLPDIFAGIPEIESSYKATLTSECCARGWWQFMPEFGARLRSDPQFGAAYDVRDCAWKGRVGARPYTPEMKAPPPNACEKATYVSGGACAIGVCGSDFRTDLGRSTRVAAHALNQALRDEVLKSSGAAVQIAIASHHAGYDDRQFYEGVKKPNKPFNLRIAYDRWLHERSAEVPTSHFYGQAMLCTRHDQDDPTCERFMKSETQRYAVQAMGRFFAAVCYYGKNYPNDPAFAPWARFAKEGQFCDEVDAPSVVELFGADR